MLTNQEIFDTVCTHLLTQAKRAVSASGSCQYHAPHGLRCAVGCLIPPEVSTVAVEGSDIKGTFKRNRAFFEFLGVREEHLRLLSDLQDIHDSREVYRWPAELWELALEQDLAAVPLLLQYSTDRKAWHARLTGRDAELSTFEGYPAG